MKTRIVLKATGTLALLLSAAVGHTALAAEDAGWYLGGNAGQAQATIDDQRIANSLLRGGFATTSINDDERDLGFKLFGGYQFNRHLAIEGGYFDLGTFGFTATTVPPGSLDGSIRLRGVNLDLVGLLPLSERFSAFARAGVNHAQARDRFTGTGAVNVLDARRDQRDTNYKFGVGLQYDLTEALGLRAEAERYRVDDAVGNRGDIDLLSLGLVYRFFGSAPVVATRAAAPEPVTRLPAPPPPVAPPPPLMAVNFSASSLFGFDQAGLKPEGRQALDQFATRLKGLRYESIRVTGHTDRIGAEDYNRRLSAERAETVKSYLVESAAIPAERITASGVASSRPLTRPGECGAERSAEVIACLQPDRRVEVEVSGTQTAP